MIDWYCGEILSNSEDLAVSLYNSVMKTMVGLKKSIIADLVSKDYFTKNNYLPGDEVTVVLRIGGNADSELLVNSFSYCKEISLKYYRKYTVELHGYDGYEVVNVDYRHFSSYYDKCSVTYTLTENDTKNVKDNHEGVVLPPVELPETEEEKKRKADIAKIEKYVVLYGEYCIKRNQLQKMITQQFLQDGGVDKLAYCKFSEDKQEEIVSVDGSNIKIFTSAYWKCFISNEGDPVQDGDMRSKYYVGYIGAD